MRSLGTIEGAEVAVGEWMSVVVHCLGSGDRTYVGV